MYIRTRLLIVFSVFLWFFGFFTGVLYRESSNFCEESPNRKLSGFIPPPVLPREREPEPPPDEPKKLDLTGNEPLPEAPASTAPPCEVTSVKQEKNCFMFQNNSTIPDKFSIIIPTYRRIKLLKEVLKNYCALHTHVDAIVVVWNNVKETIPQELKDYPCQAKLFIKKQSVNSLNNRFVLYPEIETQAVLSADDDLLIMHEDLIYQFETWKQFKHLIVGFAPRKHVELPADSGKFVYGGPPKDGESDRRYSFILTTSAMFHVQYLNLYQSQLPKHFREFVDKHMNCEDIFLNALVADHLRKMMGGKQCPALLVPYKDIKMIEGQNRGYRGLWSRPKHKKVRHECLNLISNHFKGFPFDYSTLKITTA